MKTITDANNSLDSNLAMEPAGYFRLSDDTDKISRIIQEVSTVAEGWKKAAANYKISGAEQEIMSITFI